MDRSASRRLAGLGAQRVAAAVAVMYTTGLRVSEALGLAWEDIDLDKGAAHVKRAVIEAKGQGKILGPPKTNGANGVHFLAPGAVERSRARKALQDEEREGAGLMWKTIVYEKSVVSLAFTAEDGSIGPRLRIDRFRGASG